MLVKEGAAQVEVPEGSSRKGPGAAIPGFYNMSQRINRDITIMFLRLVSPKRILDGFSGSGIRAIRFSKELDSETHTCEINPVALKAVESNIKMNNCSVYVHAESFAETSRKIPFDFIDVDPYGSAVPYLDAALFNIKNRGYIGITATDLSVLTGSYREKTLRRYGAVIVNDAFRHEKGIRLLLAYTARRAAAFDRYIEPQTSFWHGHFYRLLIRVHKGSNGSDRMLKNIGRCDLSDFYPDCMESIKEGVMWLGPIESQEILDGIKIDPEYDPGIEQLLPKLKHEDDSLFFADLQEIAKCNKGDVMSIESARNYLREKSVDSYRTHFSDTGLKTSVDCRMAYDILSRIYRQKQ